jgi:hypothetical protein
MKTAFNGGGDGIRIGDVKAKMAIDTSGGGWRRWATAFDGGDGRRWPLAFDRAMDGSCGSGEQ